MPKLREERRIQGIQPMRRQRPRNADAALPCRRRHGAEDQFIASFPTRLAASSGAVGAFPDAFKPRAASAKGEPPPRHLESVDRAMIAATAAGEVAQLLETRLGQLSPNPGRRRSRPWTAASPAAPPRSPRATPDAPAPSPACPGTGAKRSATARFRATPPCRNTRRPTAREPFTLVR